jgi:gas vesicle protein
MRLIFGIVIGAVAGALLGVMYAPDKGSETRRKIVDKSNDYTRNLRNKITNMMGKKEEMAGREFSQEAASPSI